MMSCKKDRDLQAAIALGMLWGMSQVSGGSKQSQSMPERARRLKILTDYIGIRLPVSSTADKIQVGGSTIQQENGTWVVSASGHESVKHAGYFQAVQDALTMEADAATRQALTGIAFPTGQDISLEQLNTWAAQCHVALTQTGGPFEHTPLRIVPKKSQWSSNVMTEMTLLAEEGSELPFSFAIQWGADDGVLPEAARTLIEKSLEVARDLEPALGIFAEDKLTESLLNNGYLRVVYLDAGTANTLGETVKKGWYVLRDGQPYHGPLQTAKAAAKWVLGAWGQDVEKYALIAQVSDQYQSIRNKFAAAVEQIKKSALSEKAKDAAFKQLAEQVEFDVNKLVAPYVVSVLDGTDYNKSGKRFIIQGNDGLQYKVSIGQPSKNNSSYQWNIRKIMPNSSSVLLRIGQKYTTSTLKHGSERNSMQDALFDTIRVLIAEGLVETHSH